MIPSNKTIAEHNMAKIRTLYEAGQISYQGALNFLQMVVELNPYRADELVSSWQSKQ